MLFMTPNQQWQSTEVKAKQHYTIQYNEIIYNMHMVSQIWGAGSGSTADKLNINHKRVAAMRPLATSTAATRYA